MAKTGRAMYTHVVMEAWQSVYRNPIRLRAGEIVNVERREVEPEWQGWVFCVDSRGIGGWVSETYLQLEGSQATALRDYEATELDVKVGERLVSRHQEFGWAWAENERGENGWVPLRNLRAL